MLQLPQHKMGKWKSNGKMELTHWRPPIYLEIRTKAQLLCRRISTNQIQIDYILINKRYRNSCISKRIRMQI